MKSKELKLYLSIRWTGRFGSQRAACASTLIPFLEENRIPAHWIIPCSPVLEKTQYFPLVEALRHRIHSQADNLLPMGYSGAMHYVLSLPELARELQWCRHNPWGSGVRDTLGIDPSFLFPMVADLYRTGARKLYRRKGFTAIGIGRDMADPQPFRGAIGSDADLLTVYSLPVMAVVPEEKERTRSRLFRKGEAPWEPNREFRGEPPRLLLLLDLDSRLYVEKSGAIEVLQKALEELSRRRTLRFHRLLSGLESFQRDIAAPESRSIDPVDYAYELNSDPLSRRLGAAALSLRARSKPTTGKYRTLLRRMSAYRLLARNPRVSAAVKSFPDPKRQAVASMGGDASLRGNRFTVYFQSGRLAGIEEDGELVTLPKAASSYMVIDGKCSAFSPTGSFSVEGDAVRGLRCLESIEGNSPASGASMVSDYFMVDDFPLLIVTSLIRYPGLPRASVSAVPHEIDLFRLEEGEGYRISGVYPDGAHYQLAFTDMPRRRELPGSVFFVKPESAPRNKPGIILGFPAKREPLAGTVTFTLLKRKRYAVLRAAPNASAGRAPRFQNTEELSSFYLGTSRDRPYRPPVFPPQVLREIPRHRWRRID